MQPSATFRAIQDVEAMPFDGTPGSAQALAAWAPGRIRDDARGLRVRTPDGWQDADTGEWVVRDALGSFRVVSDSDFRRAYEPAV